MPASMPMPSICSIASSLDHAVEMFICVPPPAGSERATRIAAVAASGIALPSASLKPASSSCGAGRRRARGTTRRAARLRGRSCGSRRCRPAQGRAPSPSRDTSAAPTSAPAGADRSRPARRGRSARRSGGDGQGPGVCVLDHADHGHCGASSSDRRGPARCARSARATALRDRPGHGRFAASRRRRARAAPGRDGLGDEARAFQRPTCLCTAAKLIG